jgi:hypothetical protein
MQAKPFQKYSFENESYNSSIIKEIVGPDAENLTIGYRLQETKTKMFF